jgi:Peptidase family M23/PKD domain
LLNPAIGNPRPFTFKKIPKVLEGEDSSWHRRTPKSSLASMQLDRAIPLLLGLSAAFCIPARPAVPPSENAAVRPWVRTADLDIGESQEITLHDGQMARLKLVGVEEIRDSLRQAVREARVKVEVNGAVLTLTSATYHLPVVAGGVQIDCPITRGHLANSSMGNVWSLQKEARFRLWPAGSSWMQPGTFTYPARQRWLASDTQMANEPTFVNGDEAPGQTNVYYHYGLDFGGAEGMVDVVAATDGLVVSAGGRTLPAHTNSPAQARYDVIYIVDGRGWYYRYSHLMTLYVRPGQQVRMGQRIGILGKEGGSGGWSHLHFDITSPQPSGKWGIQDAYAYVWEAWQREDRPKILALARPHRLAVTDAPVWLEGGNSWSATGPIKRYDWTFTDGTTATGPRVKRRYERPGTYSEILKVTDAAGAEAWDFAVVQVYDPARAKSLPPTIHAACYPTRYVRAGEPVTFKVRTFRTQHGQEAWDFGDGTPPERVHSDGNANVHAKDGYAVTEHRYTQAGHYLARVERSNERGETAVAHLAVEVGEAFRPRTRVSIHQDHWRINGRPTDGGTRAEGLLMNARMVNAIFEDRRRPDFDPEANTDRFLEKIPDYAAHGVRAFTVGLQGGTPGYEGALNSAFAPDGSLREPYLARARRVVEACDRQGLVVILGCYYQRQDQVLADETAVRAGVVHVAEWVQRCGFRNVLLEIANEFGHGGFDHPLIRATEGEVELIRLAKKTAPGLLVSASGLGGGTNPDRLAEAADFLLIHFNNTKLAEIPARIRALKKYGKPIVCNEDDKQGEEAARAAELCVANGASWGLMLSRLNQYFPFEFHGAADDPVVYKRLRDLTSP